MKTTGIVLLLIGISTTFGYLISLYSVAELTGKALPTISTNPFVIFFLVNVILFLLGTFLDMAATILICTPIFLPICMQFGMDPVQFGMLMLINCALGLNTPPVGTTQFVGCAIGGISVGEVMKTILPFYGALRARVVARHLRAGLLALAAAPRRLHGMTPPAPALALATLAALPGAVVRPRYDPASIGVGIVHLGLGAFHRAHGAVYADDLLARDPRWGICGVSMKTPRAVATARARRMASTRCS